MTIRSDYAKAFRDQADSDFRIFELLANPKKARHFGFSPEECHLIHYLQMSLEKITKAYRLRDQCTPMEKILSRHAVIRKMMSSLLNSPHIQVESGMKTQVLRALESRFNQIAREFEKMTPSVDKAKHPMNAEYPWESGDKVFTPCNFDFPNINFSNTSVFPTFLKIVGLAIRDFDRISI